MESFKDFEIVGDVNFTEKQVKMCGNAVCDIENLVGDGCKTVNCFPKLNIPVGDGCKTRKCFPKPKSTYVEDCISCHKNPAISIFNNFCDQCFDMMIDSNSFEEVRGCPCIMCCNYFEAKECIDKFVLPRFTKQSKYYIWLDFVGRDVIKVHVNKPVFYLFEIIYLLHELDFPQFNIVRDEHFSQCNAFETIHLSMVGFVSRKMWNKLMHALNGNTEVSREDNHGHHLPVDKRNVKLNTRNREKNIRNNKNRNGMRVFVKKQEIAPKVTAEPETVHDHAILADKTDLSVPLTVESKKEEEPKIVIDTLPNVDHILGAKYTYSYFTKNDPLNGKITLPVPEIIEHTRFASFFPRIKFRRSEPGEFMYELINILYYLFIFFFLIKMMFYTSFKAELMLKYLEQDYSEKAMMIASMRGISLAGLYGKQICNVALYLLFSSYAESSWMFFIGIWMFNIWFTLYSAHKAYMTFIKKYWIKYLAFTFYFVGVGTTYFVKEIEITKVEDVVDDRKIRDGRRESDKNFEIKQINHLCEYQEILYKRTEYGYFDKYFRFHPTGFVQQKNDVTTHKADLELVMQMMTPKNTCLNISAEAMLERLNNSTSAGPFISYERHNSLHLDIENDSSRLAQTIALHMRMDVLGTDVNNQLFRMGDMMRLYHVHLHHSHFYL